MSHSVRTAMLKQQQVGSVAVCPDQATRDPHCPEYPLFWAVEPPLILAAPSRWQCSLDCWVRLVARTGGS